MKLLDILIYNLNFFFDGYERGFASMVYKFFDKETGSGAIVNKDLAEELYKPVIKKFKVRRVQAPDLSEMKSLCSFYRGVKHLLCVTDVFTKYIWAKALKEKSP